MTATRDWNEYWNDEGEAYRAVLNSPYHQSRLTMIGSMMRLTCIKDLGQVLS